MKEVSFDLFQQFLKGVPNVVTAIGLVIISLILSKVVFKLVNTALRKIGIDKIGEKLSNIDLIQKSNFEVKISTILSKIIQYFVLLMGLIMASDALNMPAISNLVSDAVALIPNIIIAFFILVGGIILSDAIRGILLTTLKSLNIPSANLIASSIFYFLFINVFLVALAQTKINTDFLAQNISIIIGGVVFAFAIGYGLASKSMMANLLASFYSKDKFKVGDHISIDGEEGTVVDIERGSIVLKTNGKKIMIPLSKTLEDKIILHDNV